MKEIEIILITLDGLGQDYDSFVTLITTRMDPNLIFFESSKVLLDQEMRMEKKRFFSFPVTNIVTISTTSRL